jgi:hypothetical protein
MKFIRVTSAPNFQILINPAHIIKIEPSGANGTRIVLTSEIGTNRNNEAVFASENIGQIQMQLEAAGN